MTVIRTKRNIVCAYDPLPGDALVRVGWSGSAEEGGRLARKFEGPLLPLDQYDACVEWAVGIADQMKNPIHVLSRPVSQVFTREHIGRLERAVARLTDEERRELRQEAIAACAEVMRDSDDPALRREAFDVLVTMGVVAA